MPGRTIFLEKIPLAKFARRTAFNSSYSSLVLSVNDDLQPPVRHPGLWPIFEGSVDEVSSGGRLDTFVDRDGLRLWAEHSGLEILELIDGEQPHIPIDREVEFDNGLKISSLARLGPIGQSIVVCVRK